MRKYFLLIVCLLLSVAGTHASERHWTVNPYSFQYDMTAYVKIASINQSGFKVGAFCGEECRGIGKLLTAGDGTQVFQLRIRSNEVCGETMILHVYDINSDTEYDTDASIVFVSQTVEGTPSEPVLLTVIGILAGDANGDGVVNIADITAIINCINGASPANFNRTNADVNGDGDINIADITGVINIINQ